ncbi:endonuclease/exonuclease/phosphatase family protein, partial [uncultured Dietzia sp.]|uniref:endonuclease/exonuclease/phosphatase family protein n=1 Tax=uncultured Dietzia sp. TaxID=395519 RepID=UPI00260F63A1
MRRRRPVARALAVLSCLIAATGVALHHSDSDLPAVLVLASFALAAWAFSLLALVAALRARSVALTILAVVLAGAGAVQYGPLVSPSGGDDDEGVDLRVLVQNLEFGRAVPTDVVRAVREGGVDLLVTVEATPEAVDGLRAAGLTANLPHEALDPAPQTAGVAVWSRYPLSPPERVPGFGLGVVRTDMAGSAGPGTGGAAHPRAPVGDGPAPG